MTVNKLPFFFPIIGLPMGDKIEILFTETFQRKFRKIKDKATRLKITKQIKKLAKDPFIGKPLKYGLKEYRSLRVSPFRIIYRVEKNKLIINDLGHHDEVYE